MAAISKNILLSTPKSLKDSTSFPHRDNLKNREFGKGASRIFHTAHRPTLSAVQTYSKKFEAKPIRPATDASNPVSIPSTSLSTPSLIEFGASLGIGTVSLCFTTTPFAAPLVFSAIAIQTICNTVFRYYRSLDKASGKPGRITAICNYMCPTVFSYLTVLHLQTLIHELGHALAAKAVFKNAAPSITLYPFQGGATTFSIRHLSSLGEIFGKAGSLCFVAAMGPGCALLISTATIIIGYIAEHKFPELSSYLVTVGNGDFFTHAFYAFTALDTSSAKASHDFHRLAGHGLHPLVATVAILAIPVILSIAFKQPAKEPDFPDTFARI